MLRTMFACIAVKFIRRLSSKKEVTTKRRLVRLPIFQAKELLAGAWPKRATRLNASIAGPSLAPSDSPLVETKQQLGPVSTILTVDLVKQMEHANLARV